MAEHKMTPTPSIFSKQNYMWMLAGIALIAIGMFLMAGGKSDNPEYSMKKKCIVKHVLRLLPC
jgi:hypothetical protein